MKIKNKGYIIGIISILMLASSISIFVPFISNHILKHSKNSLLNFPKKYSPIRGDMPDNNQTSNILIKRLSSVVEYVTNSVIPKQNKLKCSILGGTDDSGVNHKKSELASFNSKTWIGKNRYSKETDATISNSVQRLKDEDKKINTIISVIKIHPYTYQAYLNKDGIIIPNIDFFINNENSITNLKSSKISNNLYTIGNTNPSINSVSLATEEATFSAKAISKSGMSLTRAVFSNISFTAKIITFNTKINGFQFASTTTIKGNDKSTSNTMIPSSNSLNTKNSEFIGTTAPFINDSFYLSSNKINLSKSLSRNNTLLINSDAVSASNYSSYNIVFGIANINYNGVSQFRYNKLLYSLLIAYPLAIAPFIFHISVGMSLLTIEFINHKLDKRIKKNVNAPDNQSEAQPIDNPLIPPVDRDTYQTMKNNDELLQDGDIQMLHQESELLNAKLTNILKCNDELIRRLDEANANRSDSVDTLPKANINNSKATDEAIDDTIDDASTNAGSSTHSNVLKTPANDSSTVIDPSNTNDVLKESDSINDETNDYLMGRPLQQSKVISAEHTGTLSILFVDNEQKNIIPFVMVPNPEPETKAVPPTPSLPIIPTQPTIPKQSAPLPRIASSKKEASLTHINLEIQNTDNKMKELNNNLSVLESFVSIIDNEPALIQYRDDMDTIVSDTANINRLISKEDYESKAAYSSINTRLYQESTVLRNRLLNLHIKIAKERYLQRKEEVGSRSIELLTDKGGTGKTKPVISRRKLDLRIWHEKADEYLDALTLFKKEFVFDNAHSLLFDRKKYQVIKQVFIDSVDSFSMQLLPKQGYIINQLDPETRLIHYRSIDISTYLFQIQCAIGKQEEQFLELFLEKGDDDKNEMFSVMIDDETRKIDNIQREIKKSIFSLNDGTNDITPHNVDQYNDFIQKKINTLEIELDSSLVTSSYKAEIRQKIPQMRKITQRWTEIRKNSHLLKDSKVINKETGAEMPNIRMHEGRQFNIDDDLLIAFGEHI